MLPIFSYELKPKNNMIFVELLSVCVKTENYDFDAIVIGQAIMEQKGEGNNIEYFVNTTFNYPTMAEACRVAALNGLNRLF